MLRDKSIKTGAAPRPNRSRHRRESKAALVESAVSRPPAAGARVRFAVQFPRRSGDAVKTADLLILTFLFLIMIGGFHVHAMLTMGDWDFWVDWKDRRMWPTVLPIMLVTFPAAAQYFFWVHFRLPFGATFLCVALLFGEWLDRYISFWGWTYYPINLLSGRPRWSRRRCSSTSSCCSAGAS